MQGIEVGITVNAQDDRLAVDYEMFVPVLQRGLDNPGIALSPVITASGDQSHTIVLPSHQYAEAVVFYFVIPVRAVRDNPGPGGKAKLKHEPNRPVRGILRIR